MCTTLILASLLQTLPAGAGDQPLREAIVIGSNHPLPGSDYDTLRYADDDAIRFANFFEEVGVSSTLLTVPDADTVGRHTASSERALRPTRQQLLDVLAETRKRFEAAEGRKRELYFVFSGHGSVTASRAYLHLFDAPFTRTDLFDLILRTVPAERIHIIIDSCHSYFLVNARGERVAAETDTNDLGRYPHVGFLLSTSDRREVQEWDGYRAGVFSYQVLGALRGAADVDGDDLVSYPEVHGYVMSANLEVTNPAARIRPYVRRPTVRGDTLLALDAVPRHAKTRVDSELAGHFYVLDEERGRVLDANKPMNVGLTLLLPSKRDLVVRRGEDTFRVLTSSTASAGRLEFAPDLVASLTKGSPADEFRTKLFTTPLTVDFVRGLSSVADQPTKRVVMKIPIEWYEDPASVALLAGGTTAVLLGVVSSLRFVDERELANSALVPGPTESTTAFRARVDEQDRAGSRAAVWQGLMIGGFAAGGALLIGGLIRALSLGSAEISVGPTASGNGVALTWSQR